MTLYEKEIKYLKELINNRLKHTYLDQHIQRPVIEDEKLIILNALFEQYPTYKKEKYIVTVMLIDLALKIHDSVNDGPGLPEHMPERVSKQMSVLAGDYYSGLYYLLLSELEDFKMIHTLAAAIKVINEHKMKLYYQDFSSLDEFAGLVKNVDSLPIIYMADHFNEHLFGDFIGDWLLLNQLYNAKKEYETVQPQLIRNWLGDSTTYPDETLRLYIEQKIPVLIQKIETSVSQISDRYVELATYIFKQINYMKADKTIIF